LPQKIQFEGRFDVRAGFLVKFIEPGSSLLRLETVGLLSDLARASEEVVVEEKPA
jgi:hypothetical protein